MLLAIKRTFKEALSNFWRNGWLTVATVSILLLSIFIVSVLFMVTVTANNLLQNIQEKSNISVYFNSGVTEERILEIQNQLKGFGEIKSVDYVTKEKALEEFKKNNANEPVIIKSLEELGDNPLLSSLVIRANDPSQYELINKYLNESDFKDEISRVNYGKNKEVISKLNSVIATIRRIGISLGILFGVISILITFNAIRITIYAHRKEIEVMRLVGASNAFIRLPYIFEGILYALTASAISMILLFITAKFLSSYVSTAIPSSNLVATFMSNFWLLLGMQLAIGIILGTLSSLIAMRKYLKV